MDDPERQSHSPQSRATPNNERVISVRRLLGENGRARLEHRGEIYQLQITRNGKLILTK